MKQLGFIDLRTDTDGGGMSRHVTAQEFLQAEPGERRYSDDGDYVVLASGKILTACGTGRFYDDETKAEYSEIIIGDVTISYEIDGATPPDFDLGDGYGTGRYIKI
ncbi:MAG: hypothetical protein MSS85_07670 [Pyramidobacter sp.]|uniref:hypothetical protein n=1 Tax=Pyramidobacter sp. TaxID=1943581 RepID=UPI0025E6746E|nr:hypothetical protein [Pyramidobacter sp.]MCI7403948.1 hypothetical protein [Pyramidobacter sp.]